MPMPQPCVVVSSLETHYPADFLKSATVDDISVCIVNWNCRDLLADCLRSLRQQPPGVSWEVIVVDNASTDGATNMVEHEFQEVILVRNQSNLGFSRANNQAARLARGRYLLFLNNDTAVPPGALEELVHYADANPGFGILGPRLRDSRGRIQTSYRNMITVPALLHRTVLFRWTGMFRRSYSRCRRESFDPESTREVEVLMGAALLLPRKVFFDAGMWDEGYTFGGEDMDLCYRVRRSLPVVYHPAIEIIHHGRASTRQHLRFTSRNIPAGFVRFLRRTNTSSMALVLYKCAATLDGPLQLLRNGCLFLLRRTLRQRQKASQSLRAFQSSWYFLTRGLVEFWKA
jgi:GT2 family glycosyltransferase